MHKVDHVQGKAHYTLLKRYSIRDGVKAGSEKCSV